MKAKITAIVTGVITFIIVIAICSLISKVPAGYMGIVYDVRQGVSGEVLNQGWHFTSPMKSVTLYSIGIEQSYLTSSSDGDSKDNDAFEVPTSDGKGLTVDLTFTYRYDSDQIAETFKRFRGLDGSEIKNTFIKPNVMTWTKEVTAKYPVTEILGEKRADINVILTDYLKEKFNPYGIIIENASLINIDPDDTTREAIQKKVNAQQELELAEIEKKTAKINADKEKEVALVDAAKKKETSEILAEKKLIEANADAEVIRITSEAEANAIKEKSDALTDAYVEYEKASRWNGEYPQVMAGNSSSLILDTRTNETVESNKN